jgi:hypothetical protein
MSRFGVALVVAAAIGLPAAAHGQADAERLRAAKALYFDRQYAEAREAWQAVRASGRGAEAQAALYWIARCSEGLGERERALGEYGEYLAGHPADRALAEEARTSRVALAAQLYKAGRKQHVGVLKDALADPSQTVRYFAALQMGGLGPRAGQPAVPVLREILTEEKDQDLVDRAKLILLRIDPSALAEAPPPSSRSGARDAGWIRVRIYEKGATKPQVSINLPVALAEMVFKSLPDDTRSELRRKGYDADTFWERLKKTGPTEILTIEGEDGQRIQVWLE